MSRIGEKRKRQIPEPTESVTISTQQNFHIERGINSVKIELEYNRIADLLKKHKNAKLLVNLKQMKQQCFSSLKNQKKQLLNSYKIL